ncbi:MAG: hypothetical protein EAZ27_02530 [Cytophagales bacterium]|nr:MAG: hypothetical protein EAZ53_08265 [Bacteroidota bacterium]TAG57578.1 MAG: hypothetical protein EAZ27_02530 [Cytophagales bacterium]
MKHFASSSFWDAYNTLPPEIQKIADKNFEILKVNSSHPSLHYKKVKNYRSVRVGLEYRALGIEIEENIVWFWIGNHQEYERLIK